MPIRKVVKKSQGPPDTSTSRTGEYTFTFDRPQAYKPIAAAAPTPAPYAIAVLPTTSTRDLNYFFNLAGSLYRQTVAYDQNGSTSSDLNASPGYNDDFQDMSLDLAAVMVIWLFRQTATHVLPITERFHGMHTFFF